VLERAGGFSHGNRVFTFHVVDGRGKKLDYSRAAGVLWTLGMLLGHGGKAGALTPPQPAVLTFPDGNRP
jgi:hypothetical protein